MVFVYLTTTTKHCCQVYLYNILKLDCEHAQYLSIDCFCIGQSFVSSFLFDAAAYSRVHTCLSIFLCLVVLSVSWVPVIIIIILDCYNTDKWRFSTATVSKNPQVV